MVGKMPGIIDRDKANAITIIVPMGESFI